MLKKRIKHFHLFCGLGGGAKGFNQGEARVGNVEAVFDCIGGVDVDPASVKDFKTLSGVEGTMLDLFSREQYAAFHNALPPSDWKETTPNDIRKAANNEFPNIVFLSAPCKGFSGLLSAKKSQTDKYQALNELTVRGVWLMLEAFKDNLPELILFENVPRIQSRGRPLLERIKSMLAHYGYAVNETKHCCGELGGLAQKRKRFLMVARHTEKVPAFLYEPTKKSLLPVGDVLSKLPLPGDAIAGPMHRVPNLQWKTWVRLALIEAGSDWRSLSKLNVKDGVLSDYLIVPEYHTGYLGVNKWSESTGTITSKSRPSNGNFAIADPRYEGKEYSQYGVLRWDESTGAIIGVKSPGQGTFSVADPRHHGPPKFKNEFRVTPWDKTGNTVTGASGKGQCLADPRPAKLKLGNCFDTNSGSAAGAVEQNFEFKMPAPNDKVLAMIESLDGTWHRPFTTLELAALQSLIDVDEYLELEGCSDQAWRERIGNAVPSDAAKAIADTMGLTLLLAWSGQTFALSSTPIWVRDLSIALTVEH